jgi:hypothetical protein
MPGLHSIKHHIRSAANDRLATIRLRAHSAQVGMLCALRQLSQCGWRAWRQPPACPWRPKPESPAAALVPAETRRPTAHRIIVVGLAANAVRRRKLAVRAPGKQPGLHVLAPDVVPAFTCRSACRRRTGSRLPQKTTRPSPHQFRPRVVEVQFPLTSSRIAERMCRLGFGPRYWV